MGINTLGIIKDNKNSTSNTEYKIAKEKFNEEFNVIKISNEVFTTLYLERIGYNDLYCFNKYRNMPIEDGYKPTRDSIYIYIGKSIEKNFWGNKKQ